jgi:hypothetical protein
MAMKRLYPKNEIRTRAMMFLERVYTQTQNAAIYACEQGVTQARDEGTYENQTSNLRNSIGYGIVRNGELLSSEVKQEAYPAARGRKSDDPVGSDVGSSHIKLIASRYSGMHVAGIIVAGMVYAGDVESKGFDVLTMAAEKTAERVRNSLNKVRDRLSK